MGVKIAPTSKLQWSQPMASSNSSTPLISSSSFAIPNHRKASNFTIVYASNLLGCCHRPSEIFRFQSSVNLFSRSFCRARLSDFSDEEVSEQIEELGFISEIFRNKEGENSITKFTTVAFADTFLPPPSLKLDFAASIERKANRVDIPLSLRVIQKRQRKLAEGFKELGNYGYCSVKKAFSSMVFIVRELQKCALETREALCYEDLQEILIRTQGDINASFVWLFQKVFSGTPTLMVYVMILLVNYTVHSMDYNAAIAATSAQPNVALTEIETESVEQSKFSPSGVVRKALNEGNNGGKGGKVGRVASGAEGGDRNLGSSAPLIRYPNGVGSDHQKSEVVWNDELSIEEEERLWESTVEEAWKMQIGSRAEILDCGMIERFVAPVSVELEAEDFGDYYRTELVYQMGLSQDPMNPLLLCNYAQFLFLVAHDHDRAEECFKQAIQIESTDAEALSKYADFLWVARKDLWGAEERYQQAVAVEPDNPYIASKYASFLWSTCGEETCFLVNSSNNSTAV